MAHTDLQEPCPRDSPKRYVAVKSPFSHFEDLPVPATSPDTAFRVVLAERRSRRRIGPLTRERLAALLWHGARTRATSPGSFGQLWQSRAAPSAGGLHPVDLLVTGVAGEDAIYCYDPISHSLGHLPPSNKVDVTSFQRRIVDIVPEASGCALTLVGDLAKTSAVYHNCESLIWRDAGCLIAVLHLCAQWLDLAFCPLGILGKELVASVFGEASVRVAAGVCIVGEIE